MQVIRPTHKGQAGRRGVCLGGGEEGKREGDERVVRVEGVGGVG